MDHRIEQAAKEIVKELCLEIGEQIEIAAIISRHLSSNEWVKVTDRLPEVDGTYQVLDAAYANVQVVRVNGRWMWDVPSAFPDKELEHVTHWQPLPAPPSATTQLGEEK